MFSVWPSIGKGAQLHKELQDKGYFYPFGHWSGGDVYDAYQPEARAIYWKHANEGLFKAGLDGWWMDGTEPEFSDVYTQENFETQLKKRGSCYLGTLARYFNPYSLVHTQGVYEGQRQATSDKRVVILTRSVFAGQQRNAAITWSGDTTASFSVLRTHIAAGANLGMAGVPYWSHDIGAFFAKGLKTPSGYSGSEDPAYRELYVRWFQFGAFSPVFRSHGTNTPREVWRFGEPGQWAYDALVKFDRLRYRLLPYLYSLSWQVTDAGYTLMRGLGMDFPKDRRALDLNTEYLFGPAFLVSPVTDHQYQTPKASKPVSPATRSTSVPVYLPEPSEWYDFWTGTRVAGGQTVIVPTPIDIMPLHVRAGSIIPLGPELQYTSEKPADPIEVRVYRGADGRFTLYEDEGDNYNYETGQYATIPIVWDEVQGSLSIGARQGEFPGMLKTRTFHIVWVREGQGLGVEPAERPDHVAIYDGSPVVIKAP